MLSKDHVCWFALQITRFKIPSPVLHLCPCSAVPWNYLLQLRCGEASLHPFVHAKLREMGEAQDHQNEEHGPQPDEIPHVAQQSEGRILNRFVPGTVLVIVRQRELEDEHEIGTAAKGHNT